MEVHHIVQLFTYCILLLKKAKQKYYVVWKGKQTGIFTSWAECEMLVKGVEGAKYKSFSSRIEAEVALEEGPPVWRKKNDCMSKEGDTHLPLLSNFQLQNLRNRPIFPALAVDAACSGNPGTMEFRGVIADTGTEVFHRGPFSHGTNNIGEFLAIVLGLAYLKSHNLPWVLYSDSHTALAWLKKKQAQTKLNPMPCNQPLFEMLRKAEHWLQENDYTTTVLKWDTTHWGEIPADFGRK